MNKVKSAIFAEKRCLRLSLSLLNRLLKYALLKIHHAAYSYFRDTNGLGGNEIPFLQHGLAQFSPLPLPGSGSWAWSG